MLGQKYDEFKHNISLYGVYMSCFKAAFIFLAPNVNPELDFQWVKTDSVHVKTIAVSSYQEACLQLDDLYSEGIRAIELCAGFGHVGVAKVKEQCLGRMQVGVVRFDIHPCLDNVSGDVLFS
ncbi:DUF6506 family protein [Aeromonas veronii]|jgi:hypothetical protein|uniref:DUF6506 family protein n=1 Tax=Aeromonas TaxID=642 RepID=UPI0021E8142D|nr:DUF6506 family protein [Aeromonas veronii]MCV3283521.1 DUF6506 family protein [Aeromonas veronii]